LEVMTHGESVILFLPIIFIDIFIVIFNHQMQKNAHFEITL